MVDKTTDRRMAKGKPGANGEYLSQEEQNDRIREAYKLHGLSISKQERNKRMLEIYAGTRSTAS